MVAPSLLSHVSFFASLKEEDLRALAGVCRVRRFKRGEALLREGDPGDALYILQSGHVKITVTTAEGVDTILTVEGPGECLGELSLMDGAPRSATAVAVDWVEAVTLRREDFLALIDQHPGVARAVMSGMAAMVRRLTAQVQDAVCHDVTGRLARKLLELADQHGEPTPRGPRITLKLSQEELAQMVGVTRVSVNRHLRWFEERGFLTADRDGITLHRPEELQKRIY
jgi:CRP/FNR family cyclic AMP-dependent transcriptional regulator